MSAAAASAAAEGAVGTGMIAVAGMASAAGAGIPTAAATGVMHLLRDCHGLGDNIAAVLTFVGLFLLTAM